MGVPGLPGEEWKLYPGTKVTYISNMGRARKGNKLKKIAHDSDGYKLVNINGRPQRLHVVVAKLFVPNPNNLPIVDHIDEDKENCKADNLEWVTVQENTKRYYDNLKKRGEKAKHVTSNVIAIDSGNNAILYDNQTKAHLGTGIPLRVINNIVRGVTKGSGGWRFFRAETFKDERGKL